MARKNGQNFITKLFLRSFILCLIVLLLTISVSLLDVHRLFWSTEEKELYKKVETKIDQGETIIYIKDVTVFNWDAVCFLGSYATGPSGGENLSELANVDLSKNIGEFPVLDDDGKWVLMFTMNREFLLFLQGRARTGLGNFDRGMKSFSCFGEHAKFILRNVQKGETVFYITE